MSAICTRVVLLNVAMDTKKSCGKPKQSLKPGKERWLWVQKWWGKRGQLGKFVVEF